MPMLRLGGFIWLPLGRSRSCFLGCSFFGRRLLRLGGLVIVSAEERAPAVFRRETGMLLSLADRQLRDRIHDPVEVLLADRVYVGVGRGIHEVNGVRDAVFAGK